MKGLKIPRVEIITRAIEGLWSETEKIAVGDTLITEGGIERVIDVDAQPLAGRVVTLMGFGKNTQTIRYSTFQGEGYMEVIA